MILTFLLRNSYIYKYIFKIYISTAVTDDVQISKKSLEHLSETLVDNEGCIDYAAFVDSFSMNASTLT